MMQQYDIFYRRYGVRRRNQFIEPPLLPLNELALPRASMLHYLPQDAMDYGPTNDDILVMHQDKLVMVDHILEYSEKKGEPRSTPTQPKSMIRTYHRKNRHLRPLRRMDTALRDERTLIIFNYSIVPHLYRYINNFYMEYNRWYNLEATLWDKVNVMCNQTTRHQFIPVTMPHMLPTLTQLKMAENDLNRKALSTFNTPELLKVLDMWKWLGNTRAESLMSRVDEKNLHRVNLIYIESGRFVILNLGILNDWRKTGDADEPDTTDDDGSIKPKTTQKFYLKYLMSIFEARTAGASEKAITEYEKDDDTDSDSETGDEENQGGDENETLPAKIESTSEKQEFDESDSLDDDIDESKIDKEIEEMDRMAGAVNKRREELHDLSTYQPPTTDPVEGIQAVADELADAGALSAAEYRRVNRLASKVNEISNPYGGEGTLMEFAKINYEDTLIESDNPVTTIDVPGITDKSMLNNSLDLMDTKYVKDILNRDVVAAATAIQREGLIVQNYKVERVDEKLNSYEIHTVKVVPVVGSPSTIRFRVPVIEEDGTFIANGVKCHLRRQRGDMPIRKIGPDEVALSSYYGKLFVARSDRSVNNYEQWLTRMITSKGLDNEDDSITNLRFGDLFNHEHKVPRVYSILSRRISNFISGSYFFYFNYTNRYARFGEERVSAIESRTGAGPDKMVCCGTHGKDRLLLMDEKGNIYSTTDGNDLEPDGTIETIIGIPMGSRPVEVITVGLFGKPVPLGFILAHEMGFNRLINHLGFNPRRVPRGTRLILDDNEFAIRFEDEAIVFDRGNKMAEYIFGGFNRYHKDIKRYSVYAFDTRDVYHAVLERNNLGVRYVREMDMLFKMFIDHITLEILESIDEPTDLVHLLLRAAELLLTDDHPHESSMEGMRDKGYERIAGVIYGEMVKGLRGYKSKPATATRTFDINPQAVWQNIMQDQAGKPIEESNPLAELKQREIVVFGGLGGRDKKALTRKHRQFTRDQIGITSESTPDSGDVGTVIYLTGDPKYKSVRGIPGTYDPEVDGPSRLVSPSFLMAPGSDRDDPKRANFVSVQNSQTIASAGYTPAPLRTGYERILPHRTTDLYAYTAKQNGKVVFKDDEHIVLEYEDGEKKTIKLGRRFGAFAGSTIPHNVVTNLTEGKSFKAGSVISYNTLYFQPDLLDPKQLAYKGSATIKVAFAEGSDTHEDSCAISQRLAELMESTFTKVRNVRLSFDQEVRGMVKVGDGVDLESILCTIENPVGDSESFFDERSLETLKKISSMTPKAKYIGVVEKIEVLYNGEKDDMTASLKSLTNASDKAIAKGAELSGKPKTSGRVESSYQVDGQPITADSVVIKVYITGPASMGVGDKLVFANQMKSVVGRVMVGENTTEAGESVDAIFGYLSAANRIVDSAIIIGTTNTLLREIGNRAVAAYRGKGES